MKSEASAPTVVDKDGGECGVVMSVRRFGVGIFRGPPTVRPPKMVEKRVDGAGDPVGAANGREDTYGGTLIDGAGDPDGRIR